MLFSSFHYVNKILILASDSKQLAENANYEQRITATAITAIATLFMKKLRGICVLYSD